MEAGPEVKLEDVGKGKSSRKGLAGGAENLRFGQLTIGFQPLSPVTEKDSRSN